MFIRLSSSTAWLAARHPGRVGVGLAAGALEQDFAVMDLDMRDLTARFTSSLERVTELLRGDKVVARAATTWALIGLASGRPQRIPEELTSLFGSEGSP